MIKLIKRNHQALFLYVVVFISILSCASQKKIVHGSLAGVQTFPNGVYRHEISLEIKDGTRREFSGIVSLKPTTITVVGLSSFATTVFKIKEDRLKDEVVTEIYFEPFKKIEAKIVEFYRLTREFLLLKKTNNPKSEYSLGSGKFQLRLSDWDEHQIPGLINIFNDDVKIQVRVVGYELGEN